MEQTTNVFNKGLQTDTHPMVQGNDTLSDALNATLVTMNGNEVVLQNDMGNAKIDNAYLPPGYQPVGMKEYGGIIYVAAYNPITNKSQIGSFPSPERKISVEDKDLGNTIDLDTDFSFNTLEGINFLNNDILLIPLTSDTSLHAGDKFTVYSNYIWQNKDNITNFDNIVQSHLYQDFLGEGDTYKKKLEYLVEYLRDNELTDYQKEKILNNINIYQKFLESESSSLTWCFSPKNKKYTLSLGILNSQNEFVDITKSLVRWKDFSLEKPTKQEGETDDEYNVRSDVHTYKEALKKYKPIEFTNESNLVKFNTGYFIAKDFDEDPLEEYTGNDKELIAERQKMAVNSYAYKLIGPLYLKAELNHIKNFDFSIEGTKIPDSTDAEVLIRATITYNCPDGINTISEVGDSNYFDYFQGELKNESIFPGFHLYKKSINTYEREYTTIIKQYDEDNDITTIIDQYDEYYNKPETKYNPETNLYEVTIEKKYTISPTSDNKYEYYVCVPSGYESNNNDVYIKGLSTKGEIDFNKLGIGTLEINEWRFYNTMPTENNSGKTILTYGFNSYPRIGHTISDIKFELSYRANKVGLLVENDNVDYIVEIEEQETAKWFLKTYPEGVLITPENYEKINELDVLWINIDRDIDKINNNYTVQSIKNAAQEFFTNNVIDAVKNHVLNGGKLYLTKYAAIFIEEINNHNNNFTIYKEYIATRDYDDIIIDLQEYSGDQQKIQLKLFNNLNSPVTFCSTGGYIHARYIDLRELSLSPSYYEEQIVERQEQGGSQAVYRTIALFKSNNSGDILIDSSIYTRSRGSFSKNINNINTLQHNSINYLLSLPQKEVELTSSLVPNGDNTFGALRGNLEFDWNNLYPRELYDVKIQYTDIDELNQSNIEQITTEWILTTELFNECYPIESDSFINDYAKFNDGYDGELNSSELKTKNRLLNINIDIQENIKYDNSTTYDTTNFNPLLLNESSLNSPHLNQNVISTTKNTYNFNFSLNNPTIEILNKELYPKQVTLNGMYMTSKITPTINGISQLENSIEKKKYGTGYDITENIISSSIPDTPKDFNFNENTSIYNIEISITQIFKSKFKDSISNIIINNLFESFKTVFNSYPQSYIKEPYYSIGAYSEKDEGGRSPAIAMYMVKHPNNIVSPVNIIYARQLPALFEYPPMNGDYVRSHLYSEKQDLINSVLDREHEKYQFVVGITHRSENHSGINASNSLNRMSSKIDDNDGDFILTVWIRVKGGWAILMQNVINSSQFSFDSSNNATLNNIENNVYNPIYTKLEECKLGSFHTNFKTEQQQKNLLTIKDDDCVYIYPYNINFTHGYEVEVNFSSDNEYITFEAGNNLKFNLNKTIIKSGDTPLNIKSNEKFDKMVSNALQAASQGTVDFYDIDCQTFFDSDGNDLKPNINYKEESGELIRNFKDANNIQQHSLSDDESLRIFSFPLRTSGYSGYQQATYVKSGDSGEGNSRILLYMDVLTKSLE